MRFDEEFDDNSGSPVSVVYMALGVSAFILLLFGLIILINKRDTSSDNRLNDYYSSSNIIEDDSAMQEYQFSEDKKRAEDLDIWDMYPEHAISEIEADIEPEITKDLEEPSISDEEKERLIDEEMNDGKHYKLELSDGSHEWLAINTKLEKNNYDLTNLVDTSGYLKYYSNGRQASFLGVDISHYQGDIDFNRVKESGIDFCMIRVGARGYKTGSLALDDKFQEYMTGATEAGLGIGVYFYSQAISVKEAEEEADMLLGVIDGFKVNYPIAIDMELPENDSSRIETLTTNERTTITAAFVNKISGSGHIPMIYGNKEWLLKKIDIARFTTSTVWLSDDMQMTDYPYTYSMWQYTKQGSVDGINSEVGLNLCFIDYSAM